MVDVVPVPVAVAQTVVETPVVAVAPVPTPTAAVEAVQTPAVVPAPVVAPVVETPPATIPEAVAPVIAEVPKPAETTLGEALDKKPVEAPKEGDAPVEEIKPEGQSDKPAPPPSYEPFKLPEGISLEPDRLGNLTKLLGDLEVTGKVEHTAMQEFGQKLLDTHIDEVKSNLDNYQKLIQTSWDNQKVAWKEDFLKDPELGGNRFQTTIDSALSFIRTHGGTPEEQQEFRNLMEVSGLGNHKAMIRILAKAGSAMSEGKPLAAKTPVSAPKSKISTMYGKNA